MLSGMSRSIVRSIVALTAVLVLAVSVGVLGAAAVTPRAKGPAVTIKGFAFSPKTLTVKAGAKVKVSNKDGTTHTFTANKGAFDTGDIDGGSSATVTIKKPGTYAYHCNIHSSMKGTIKAT
jgi:plastocyanin